MLTARFGVNRHTVRRALEDLEARGLIRVEQGRGAFVAEDVVDYRLGPRTRFSNSIRTQNREPAGRILRVAETPAETQLAEALGIRRGRLVLRAERLGLVDGRPIVLGVHHFPLPRCASAGEALARDPSITAAWQPAASRTTGAASRASPPARLPTPRKRRCWNNPARVPCWCLRTSTSTWRASRSTGPRRSTRRAAPSCGGALRRWTGP